MEEEKRGIDEERRKKEWEGSTRKEERRKGRDRSTR